MSAARELLEAGFGAPLPERLAGLVRPELDETGLEAFEASVVLPLDGGRARLAASDAADRAGWERSVLAGWGPSPRLRKFLSLVPGARRMIDSDGGPSAEVFLDDLQAHGHPDLMCLTLGVPGGETIRITRHQAPPLGLLHGEAKDTLADLLARGAEGLWGVRWRDDRAAGFLWVSESRWRKNADQTRAVAESFALPEGWRRMGAAAAACGLALYPDAMDFRDGRFDLTVGLVRTDRGA